MSEDSMLRITSPEARARRKIAAEKRDKELRAIQGKMMKSPIQWPEPMANEWKEARDNYIKVNSVPF